MSIHLPDALFVAQRTFQYDYIYVDALFLLVWIGILLWRREYKALAFGAAIAPMIYLIDAVVWWNASAGAHYPLGTHIREYWIGNIQVARPLGALWLRKFGADFMMTISYALYAFPWLWIVFREIRQVRSFSKPTLLWTALWLTFWLLVPAISRALPIDDTPVVAVRYMYSQFPLWLANLVVGYGVLAIFYRHRLRWVGWLFLIGVIGSLVMEMPLYVFHIRPANFLFLLFEGVFLLNQGIPWLFLLTDKLLDRSP
ncbi:MAG TPA: hypothetical protein VHE55_10000 [Fimbriimonadaceae bacterium]|nr:hypothetical protein [Fimbriimonadaceae bacterium]